MSKYEELRAKALAAASAWEASDDCMLVAMQALHFLASEFGFPDTHVTHVALNDELQPIGLGGSVRASYPFLTKDKDDFWTCAVQLKFGGDPGSSQYFSVILLLSFRQKGEQVEIRCRDQIFSVTPGDRASFQPFLDYLFSDLSNGFPTQESRKRPIGFYFDPGSSA